MTNPLISIIIPSFNSAETIGPCLESIQRQTYKNFEVIVVDGLSKDNTIEIVKSFPVRWISEKDNGVYDAMNKGIRMARGSYFYFMGSDDTFFSNDTLNDIFGSNANTEDFIYGNVRFKESGLIYSGESNLMKLVRDRISICHQAIFYSRRTFEVLGEYDTNFFIHADHDFNVRCFSSDLISKKYLDMVIAVFNERGLSGTKSNADGFQDHLIRYYVENFADPVELFRKNEQLESEIQKLKRSRDYKVGSSIMKAIRKIKSLISHA